MTQQRGKYGWFQGNGRSFDHLLTDPVVRDWIDSYTVESTRTHHLYQFQKVLEASRLPPKGLLDLEEKQAKLLIRRVSQSYLQKGKSTWARQLESTMRGFYEAHDKEIKFKRTERIKRPPRKKISIEIIPSKTDIYRMADVAVSPRNRAIILCLFQSGVRVSCLCNWTFGLVKDQLYPTVRIPVHVKVTPAMDTKLNLYGLPYYVTFINKEAAETLRRYIDLRIEVGWSPKLDSRIFITDSSMSQGEDLNRHAVWELIKRTAKLAGLNPGGVWTHTIRKAFRKVLNAAPKIDEDTKEALMGHSLPGSRGSYFDYHDENEMAEKYTQADWSRNGSTDKQAMQIEDLEKKYLDLWERFKMLKDALKRDDSISEEREKSKSEKRTRYPSLSSAEMIPDSQEGVPA